MSLWKLTLTYDGTSFHGWQIQPALPTIQGTLAEALKHITGESVLPQGSGRTDTGVHALGQVASVTLTSNIPAANLLRALNRTLPASIRVLAVQPVDPPFHARHSALRKTYEYRIFPTRDDCHICPPMLAPFVWDHHRPLDLSLLNQAAAHVLGRHDFTSFAASGSSALDRSPSDPLPGYPSTPATPCRVLYHSSWNLTGDLLIYRVTGSGFLHHMVRNLVGTFVEAASGRIAPDAIASILAARSRSAAGPTAPARGLFLVHVEYP